MQLWNNFQEAQNVLRELSFEFERPIPLDFQPKHQKAFEASRMSKTSLAPVWGQHASFFSEPLLELNAGPKQTFDGFVKYQQAWVERNLLCPFCDHVNWNMTYCVAFHPPEQFIYDPSQEFYVLLCPKCERAAECIPRQLVGAL